MNNRFVRDSACTDDSYDDILNLPHHVSSSHPHMPLSDRAAQFSPFAALSGYHESIMESERLTEEKKELDENEKNILDEKMHMLLERAGHAPAAEITCFVPDSEKPGGSYQTFTGRIKKLIPGKRALLMDNGQEISIDHITDIQGEIFDF